MATIKDVAKACGLSSFTVSAVLNNRPGEASAETRERVLRVVEEIGYQRNAIARGLSMRRMNTIGLVMAYGDRPSLASHHYISPLLDGIFAANKRNRQRTLVITEDNWDQAYENLPTYLDGHCDALIFIIPTAPSEMFLRLHRQKFPFVIVGEDRPEAGLSIVDLDNHGAGYDATVHLLTLGHKRIAMLKGDGFFMSSAQRESGYRQAMDEWNVPVDEALVVSGHYTESSGYSRSQELLRLPQEKRPTAFFCGDDMIALGTLRGVTDIGLKVPDEISIIGINNDEAIRSVSPGLTTISHPLEQIGEASIEMALEQIAAAVPEPSKKLVRGELILRASTSFVRVMVT